MAEIRAMSYHELKDPFFYFTSVTNVETHFS